MTGNYNESHPEPDYCDMMTVSEFVECVDSGCFIDFDGFGYPSNGTHMDPNIHVNPSEVPDCIPSDATHIVWFNK